MNIAGDSARTRDTARSDGAKSCHDEHDVEYDGPKPTINEDDAAKGHDRRKGYDE